MNEDITRGLTFIAYCVNNLLAKEKRKYTGGLKDNERFKIL